MKKFFTFATIAMCLSGCSNEQVYNSLSGAKESECQKIVDANERNRCLDAAKEPYGKYQQRREETQKN
jgi:hypothetical protein